MSGAGLEKLKAKPVVFIVKKLQNYVHLAGHPFEVMQLSNDEEIIESYNFVGKNYTPLKVNRYVGLSSMVTAFFLFKLVV